MQLGVCLSCLSSAVYELYEIPQGHIVVEKLATTGSHSRIARV